MELRRHIKAPKRFDDDDDYFESPAPKRELRRPPASIPPRKFPISFIDFNPHLPPAAFPTLDFGEVKKSDADVPARSDVREPRKLTNTDIKSRTSSHTESCISDSIINSTQQAKIANMTAPLRKDGLEFHPETRRGDDPEPGAEIEGGRLSNGPLNPVWVANIKLMEKFDERTDEDWFMAEMETSDEEDPFVGSHIKKSAMTDRPTWEELSVAHQVDIVNLLSDCYESREGAMKKLRLNPFQRITMLQLLDQREELEAAENEGIEALQKETNRILMTGDANRSRHMSQAKFSELVNKHLDRFAEGEEDFNRTTPTELEKAKRYLQSCGHDPKLLDHWAPAFGGSQMLPSSASLTVPEGRTIIRQSTTSERCTKSLTSWISEERTLKVSSTDHPPQNTTRPLPDIQVTMALESTNLQSDESSASMAAISKSLPDATHGGISNRQPQIVSARIAATDQCTPTLAKTKITDKIQQPEGENSSSPRSAFVAASNSQSTGTSYPYPLVAGNPTQHQAPGSSTANQKQKFVTGPSPVPAEVAIMYKPQPPQSESIGLPRSALAIASNSQSLNGLNIRPLANHTQHQIPGSSTAPNPKQKPAPEPSQPIPTTAPQPQEPKTSQLIDQAKISQPNTTRKRTASRDRSESRSRNGSNQIDSGESTVIDRQGEMAEEKENHNNMVTKTPLPTTGTLQPKPNTPLITAPSPASVSPVPANKKVKRTPAKKTNKGRRGTK